MRKVKIAVGEYYHIYNRGNNKQIIFLDNRDWTRFLFLMIYFQSPLNFQQIGRLISFYVKHSVFNIKSGEIKKITENRYIELINFALIPNHFHLLIREIKERGISRYMQRVQNAYTKYFNAKYKKSGHLFQGPFQIVHIQNNELLLHLSAYIHRNPREIKEWKNQEYQYPWSSYQDCLKENRWEELLKPQIITNQFNRWEEYKDFVETSGAKSGLEAEYLLDIE